MKSIYDLIYRISPGLVTMDDLITSCLPRRYRVDKPKMECRLPECTELTDHNGGYCCADHCKEHQLRIGVRNKIRETIRMMSDLKVGWDSYDAAPPNVFALKNAVKMTDLLCTVGLLPTRVAPSVDEGVTISFCIKNKYLVLECSNDSGIVIGYSKTDEEFYPVAWEVKTDDEIIDSIEKIKEYLNG